MNTGTIINGLRRGDWINPPRIRLWSIAMLVVGVAAIGVLFFTGSGKVDYQGRPIGTDFSNVYSAGKMALEGHAPLAYSPPAHYAVQQEIFHQEVPFYGWHYPPFFLMTAALLASLPYLPALGLWMAISLVPYLVTVRTIFPSPTTLLAAGAFPAVFINIIHGQNGLLSAALLGGGLWFIPSRPWLGGLLIGLLAYKPQYGLLIPIALIAARHWTVFASAALTVLGLCGVSTLLFGGAVWSGFYESLAFTQHTVLESGGTGFYKMQSLFAALRNWGLSPSHAYIGQGMLLVMLAGLTAYIWRQKLIDYPIKATSLIIASFLATPYSMDYDMVTLAPAMAFMLTGWRKAGTTPAYGYAILALAALSPLLTRNIQQLTTIPLGLLATFLLLFLACAPAIPAWKTHTAAAPSPRG